MVVDILPNYMPLSQVSRSPSDSLNNVKIETSVKLRYIPESTKINDNDYIRERLRKKLERRKAHNLDKSSTKGVDSKSNDKRKTNITCSS